ncbi:GntR family transcriptional regulator [Allonocardiopsis opalescens]|uniref:GntR family transcriptional regulator n=1 Tax=Allonocardiopsis opalescens TaxID=1144618 RepID=A0A2T0PY72_9ACTN|nr:GntR family transcriptional regulator [Allonocardiopsis opalescens]PRX96491.1 GntR family transcriptional regulator [Allonocardiopsis opalescens]
MPSSPLAKGSNRIQRPVPLREGVYEALLELIIMRELQPGQHLVESELAMQLGVSRQPVREALQRLSTEGWVDLRPGYGAFVHTPTEKEADQLLAVRALLETESAGLAAVNRTEEGLARLRELWDAGVAAVEAGDVDAVVLANADFHMHVVQLSDNAVLAELAAQVDRRVRWYYAPVARLRGRRSWEEHAKLIEAIAEGDADAARRVMRDHTENTRRTYHEQVDGAGVEAAGV